MVWCKCEYVGDGCGEVVCVWVGVGGCACVCVRVCAHRLYVFKACVYVRVCVHRRVMCACYGVIEVELGWVGVNTLAS